MKNRCGNVKRITILFVACGQGGKKMRNPNPVSSSSHSDRSLEPLFVKKETLVKLFECPITHEIMQNPVIMADGHTYERKAIVEWIADKKSVYSPMTNQLLSNLTLTPNHIVSQMITVCCGTQQDSESLQKSEGKQKEQKKTFSFANRIKSFFHPADNESHLQSETADSSSYNEVQPSSSPEIFDKSLLRSHLTCPLTKHFIVDPVVAADGVTYEAGAIQKSTSTNQS
jgi:hypothetical protein